MGAIARRTRYAVASAAAFGALLFAAHRAIDAADHFDSPPRTDPLVDPNPDLPADIADVYAFFDSQHVVLILTFAGPQPANRAANYDRDVLYRINVSNDGDPATTEFPIEFRFGPGGGGFGVQVTGLPGGVAITGPVESSLEKDGILVRAGLYDDPFFFDLQGFRESRASGELRFNPNRDFFTGQNDTAIVIQIPRARVQNGNRQMDVWAETLRFGGQI